MSKFQQRHFEAIAEVMQEAGRLNINFAHEAHSGRVEAEFSRGFDAAVDYICSQLSNAFKRNYPNFDAGRFERACVPRANVRNKVR